MYKFLIINMKNQFQLHSKTYFSNKQKNAHNLELISKKEKEIHAPQKIKGSLHREHSHA